MIFKAAILPVLLFATPSWQYTYFEEGSCRIIGDADLYGIGVRISFYLQWFTGVLAVICGLDDELHNIRRGIVIVSLVVFINTLISTVQGSFAILEWNIIPLLTTGIGLGCFCPGVVRFKNKDKPGHVDWEYDTPTKRAGVLFGLMLLLNTVVVGLQPWLFFKGLYQGYKPGCSVKTFVYAPFDIYDSHWIMFCKIMSIFGCILGLFWLLTGINLVLKGLSWQWCNDDEEDNKKPEGDKSSSNCVAKVLVVFSGASSIAFAEEIIRVNRLDLSYSSVLSTTQFIPLLIGVFNATAVLWGCVTKLHGEIVIICAWQFADRASMLTDCLGKRRATSKGANSSGSDYESISDSQYHGHGGA